MTTRFQRFGGSFVRSPVESRNLPALPVVWVACQDTGAWIKIDGRTGDTMLTGTTDAFWWMQIDPVGDVLFTDPDTSQTTWMIHGGEGTNLFDPIVTGGGHCTSNGLHLAASIGSRWDKSDGALIYEFADLDFSDYPPGGTSYGYSDVSTLTTRGDHLFLIRELGWPSTSPWGTIHEFWAVADAAGKITNYMDGWQMFPLPAGTASYPSFRPHNLGGAKSGGLFWVFSPYNVFIPTSFPEWVVGKVDSAGYTQLWLTSQVGFGVPSPTDAITRADHNYFGRILMDYPYSLEYSPGEFHRHILWVETGTAIPFEVSGADDAAAMAALDFHSNAYRVVQGLEPAAYYLIGFVAGGDAVDVRRYELIDGFLVQQWRVEKPLGGASDSSRNFKMVVGQEIRLPEV